MPTELQILDKIYRLIDWKDSITRNKLEYLQKSDESTTQEYSELQGFRGKLKKLKHDLPLKSEHPDLLLKNGVISYLKDNLERLEEPVITPEPILEEDRTLSYHDNRSATRAKHFFWRGETQALWFIMDAFQGEQYKAGHIEDIM